MITVIIETDNVLRIGSYIKKLKNISENEENVDIKIIYKEKSPAINGGDGGRIIGG